MLHTVFVLPTDGLPESETLLTRREVAIYRRKSVASFERYARLGIGPEPKRIGGRIYYTLHDVRRFAGVSEKAA